jgi:23S rRNA (cytosine1962-C5)-methyltransferase
MRVAQHKSKNAKAAVTSVAVVERVGDRALLELELETGRTHQARVQLAHARAPIAGDSLYGGAPAPRLMLHAAGLELEHPSTGKPARFALKPPPDFKLWVARGDLAEGIYDDADALGRAIARAVERRWGLARASGGDRATTAFRLIHEAGDGMPRLAVDVYDRWLVAQLYGEDGPWADAARRERVLDRLGALGFDGVYVKVRPKQSNALTREPGSRHDVLAPPGPVRGAAAPSDVPIVEEGMPLLARLGDGLSTGVFLDQRGNRRRVRDASRDKRVANLFAYTCAFTVAAALGGAAQTTSVDVSMTALERGRQNLAAAGFADRPEHALVADDVFSWLARAARRAERYDLVILDPPSYSTTKRGRFVADHDYVELAAAALALLGPGGQMLACTNHRGIHRQRFRRMLFDAGRAAKLGDLRVRDLPDPSDYPVAAGQDGNTKSVWVSS